MSERVMDKYSLIIFDWDGTLVDSISSIVKALRQAAVEERLPVLDDVLYRGVVGLSLAPAMEHLYPALSANEVERLCRAYKKHHLVLEEEPSRPFVGVLEGLPALRDSKILLAVATGKRRSGLQRSMIANDVEAFFDASLTADDARSKPDPDMIEQLMKRFQLMPEQILMVGDSGFDMEMACRAGVDRLAVTYGAGSREDLERYQPVFIADDFDGVLVWLGVKPVLEQVV
ncbi:HAD family hydrolase [Endozoicomonas elysicola]|nr:HAD-IA family hydrolase [Endozoicomonas elysicola]